MSARKALEIGTLGGAAVLGRSDIGSLETGKCADFIAFNLRRLEFAGGIHDPVAATILCSNPKVDWNIVHGRVIVKEGQLVTVDVDSLVGKHNQAARRLINPGL